MRALFIILLFLCSNLTACSEPADNPHEAFRKQEEKVAVARSTHSDAVSRLKAMEDSLEMKIKQNIGLGMSKEQAAAVEQALIESQKALVKAAEKNLSSQIDVLKRLRSLTRGP